jgi:gas vesicle protein
MISQKKDYPQIIALSTEIGRGHPHYLDSVCQWLKEKNIDFVYTNVFEQSQGYSLFLWKLVKWAYFWGAKGGVFTKLYNSIRENQKIKTDSLFLKILGKDLKKNFSKFKGICLVEHPLVALILSQVCRDFYVHGEIAAPQECTLSGAEKIFVPLEETKENLINFGASPNSIFITGLLIEPGLVKNAKEVFEKRKERIRKESSLTIGFFTSGAYPKKHLEKILFGVKSVVKENMKAIVFTGTNYKKFKEISDELKKMGLKISEDIGESKEENDSKVRIVWRKTRQEETQRTVELFSQLDSFVAASHERTNWAIGLGLPLFVLFPLIGTFSPQNLAFALKQKVACPLDSKEKALNLGKIIKELKEKGELWQMAENGFGFYEIDGVEKLVSYWQI